MRKSRFTAEQIAHALRQVDAGVPVAGLCRKLGVGEPTFYAWKKKYAGMGIVEVRHVKQIEDENRLLKSLVVDLTLDKHVLQEVLRKEFLRKSVEAGCTPLARPALVGTFSITKQRACRLVGLGRSMLYQRSWAKHQSALRTRPRELAAARPLSSRTPPRRLSTCTDAWRTVPVGAHEEPRNSELAAQERFLRRRVSVAPLDCSASRLR